VCAEKDTQHANLINCQKPFAYADGKMQLLSTSDPNGYIHYWKVDKL